MNDRPHYKPSKTNHIAHCRCGCCFQASSTARITTTAIKINAITNVITVDPLLEQSFGHLAKSSPVRTFPFSCLVVGFVQMIVATGGGGRVVVVMVVVAVVLVLLAFFIVVVVVFAMVVVNASFVRACDFSVVVAPFGVSAINQYITCQKTRDRLKKFINL